MDNAWILILTSLASGLIGAILTFVVQFANNKKEKKDNIFSTLMSHRYMIYVKENVDALNRVQVIFYRHKNVIEAYSNFLAEAKRASEQPDTENKTNAKYLKLLEEMAKVLHYKKISWDKIEMYYYPKGLSTKFAEEETIRKIQIENGKKAIDANNSNSNNSVVGMQILLQMMNSPNGPETVANLIEKFAEKNKK